MQPSQFENHMVITVLILNLPRGVPLSCYQGKPWKCVHIDDPSSSNQKTPSLQQCRKMKPSEIIGLVIHNTKLRAGMETDVAGEAETQISVKDTSVCVESIIIPALPIVLSAIDGHDETSYEIIRDNILRGTKDSPNIMQEVVVIWLEYTQNLLHQVESRNNRYNWVTSHAAKAVNMKRSETLRSSLETSLHSEIRPALAAVLAQCEPYSNLALLVHHDSLSKKRFWLDLMKACFSTKLSYSDVATNDEKLPERFKVGGNQGGIRFNCRFPFSWIVLEIINEILQLHPDNAEYLFSETPVGHVITEYFKMTSRSEGSFKDWAFDRYISDFIHFSHPCHSEQEHELVVRSMLAMRQRLANEGSQFDSLVSIHQLFDRYSENYSKLSVIVNVTLRWNIPLKDGPPLWSAVCSDLLQKKEDLIKYPCYILLLMNAMNLVQKIPMREFKQDFSGYISIISSLDGLFKEYILQMPEEDDEGLPLIPYEFEQTFGEMKKECLIYRHQLILKKNYIQHVVLKLNPGVNDHENIQVDQLSNISRACQRLTEFKEWDSFNKVVKALEDSLVQKTRKVFNCGKECRRCRNAMISPVRLPCSHFVCNDCSQSPNLLCAETGCRDNSVEVVNYDPNNDEQLNREDVRALEIHRTYLNEFFMVFVSDVVFHPEFENSQLKEPCKQVIEYLVNCITAQKGTRKFSIFNAHDVIDQKSPVVRTFLLKLLLHVALREDYNYDYDEEENEGDDQTKFVATNQLMEFVNKPALRTYAELKAQTIALLIDCIKDYILDSYELPDFNSTDINTVYDNIAPIEDTDWFREVSTLSLNQLKDTAYVQIVLERVILYIMSAKKHDPILTDYLRHSLDDMETVSEQPKLYICRLIHDQFGEGKIMDIQHNQELLFLLPECIKTALVQFTVDDHLSIQADAGYRRIIDITNRVLTNREEQLDEPMNELRQITDRSILLHALFTRVTRYFTTRHRPNENRINEIRQLLRGMFTHRHELIWFESLLSNNILGGVLPLNSSDGALISMLVLRTFTTLRAGQGLLAPLANILNSVHSCATSYLPTMPDNPIEEVHATVYTVLDRSGDRPTAYECPNGHVYYVGNCGRPLTVGRCDTCGAEIGGLNHQSAAGNRAVQNIQQYRTLPGYLEEAATREPVAERNLSVLSLTVMRCLLHVCLLTAAVTNGEQVNELIRRGHASVNHLIARIKSDVKHLSNSLNTNQERIMILLHLTLHRMSLLPHNGRYNLADKDCRKTWETHFDIEVIKPIFHQNAGNLAEQQQQLISENTDDIRTLLNPSPHLVQNNLLSSSYMWIYKRPLNLDTIRKSLPSEQESLLKRILMQGTQLQLVSNLPEIVTLIKKLSNKFDNKYTQQQSRNIVIETFLSENEEFRELVDMYINVWNTYTKLHNDEQTDDTAHIFPIKYRSALLEILPITVSSDNPNGSTYRRIVDYLTVTHNSFVNYDRTNHRQSQNIDEGIDVSLVTQSHLVCLTNDSEELVPIVMRHSQYEFGESFERTCDWEKVDEDIGYQYIAGRRLINSESINVLPAYHFPNEFTIITLINKLREQKLVKRGDKGTLMQRLGGRSVRELNDIINQLETMIKICSTIRKYDNTKQLHSAIQKNFDEEPDWLIASLEVKHLVSLWTVVKFLQAKAFIKNQQLAFDEIVGECKKDLDESYKDVMRERMASYQSHQTHLILEHLFEFILFKLNNVTAHREELLFNQPLSDCVDQYLMETYDDEDGEDIDYGLMKVEGSPQIPVSQATAAWEYLYYLYTTPIVTKSDRK